MLKIKLSLATFFTGAALIIFGAISFMIKALEGVEPLTGVTLPLLLIGVSVFLVGVVLVRKLNKQENLADDDIHYIIYNYR